MKLSQVRSPKYIHLKINGIAWKREFLKFEENLNLIPISVSSNTTASEETVTPTASDTDA